jgi:hypothetical protein
VEALAFVDDRHSVYKFFLFREGGDVGATFAFRRDEDDVLNATAVPGSYRMLFEKLRLTHQFGIPTEITGITPEGILVAKQTFGRLLPEKTDMSGRTTAMSWPTRPAPGASSTSWLRRCRRNGWRRWRSSATGSSAPAAIRTRIFSRRETMTSCRAGSLIPPRMRWRNRTKAGSAIPPYS